MNRNIVFVWTLKGKTDFKDGFAFNEVGENFGATKTQLDGITEDMEQRKITHAAYIIYNDNETVEFLEDFSNEEYRDMFEIWDKDSRDSK